jgi:choline dehydrogenase-like flavoprotein
VTDHDLFEYYANPDSGAWEEIGYRVYPGDRPGPVRRVRPKTLPTLRDVNDDYDVVVVGSGAGGGVAACVLAEAGASVLVVERGEWLDFDEIKIDHLANHRLPLRGDSISPAGHPRAVPADGGGERAVEPHDFRYHNNAITAGGGTRLYLAQAWRFSPLTFRMASTYGVPEGSALADWPIDYDDLAPYYDRVEWELGVAGEAGHAWEGPRARGYPMPPFERSLEAARLETAASTLGWRTAAVPMLINSVTFNDRPACIRCAQCVGFPCPVEAKTDARNALLPRAVRAGAHVLCGAQVTRVDDDGRVTISGGQDERVVIAGRVVLSAGAIETARLLLLSGLGNEWVGKCLQGHGYAGAFGRFADPIIDGLGPGPSVATREFEHHNEGIVGGGMLATEGPKIPAMFYATALPPGSPRRGAPAQAEMAAAYLRTSHVMGPVQEMPNPDAIVELASTVRDGHGVPVARLRGVQHREDLRAMQFLAARAAAWMEAAGAERVWTHAPREPSLSGGQHQAGTARMAADPSMGATDRWGRVFGCQRVHVADASLHVTNGAVNPVLTILAMAWRIADRMAHEG